MEKSPPRSIKPSHPIILDLIMKNKIPPEQFGMRPEDLEIIKDRIDPGHPNLSAPNVKVNNELEENKIWWLLRGLLLSFMIVYLILRHHYLRRIDLQTVDYTIRVNTFRRNDLLEKFLNHYVTCPEAVEIQVIWSDLDNHPPEDWLQLYTKNKVTFEVHKVNSLSNRFKNLSPISTEAVLSIDDDILVSCSTLRAAAKIWSANKLSTVGFAPRLAEYMEDKSLYKYNGWKKTWLTGSYSLVLTKVCFLHRDYLPLYEKEVPIEMLTYIDSKRNCEDLTMSNLIAKHIRSPPVWVQGIVYEIAESGISSGDEHFDIRGECLSLLRKMSGLWPWPRGHQKAVKISFFDILPLLRDSKP